MIESLGVNAIHRRVYRWSFRGGWKRRRGDGVSFRPGLDPACAQG